MNLRFGQFQIQTQRTRSKKKKSQHKNCRQCGSKNLLSSGPDQFCCDCDWHSCFEYVDKGYMNNLHFAYCEHFPKAKSQKNMVTSASVLNLIFGQTGLKTYLVYLPTLSLAITMILAKRGKPDNFLLHYLRYQLKPKNLTCFEKGPDLYIYSRAVNKKRGLI